MDSKTYISVILPLKLEWEPCYYTTEAVHSGDRVKVKFSNKEYIGVISSTCIKPDVSPEKIKEIISVERNIPAILPQEIRLWRDVSEYYLCTIGEVYKAAYPNVKTNLEQARAEAILKVCARRKKAVESIRVRIDKLRSRFEKKVEALTKSREGSKARMALEADIKKIQNELMAGTEALEAAINSLKAAEDGITIDAGFPLKDSISLSPAQQKAISGIHDGFNAGKTVLLHGVTGSGKTEIYIKLAHEVLSKGQNVLYLVPEIALSRQLEARLEEHFGERLITFHSGESAASRRNSTEIIRNLSSNSGNYVALCTRSGLFLPHHDLGLIIVDEEHDSSYKQDSPAPRYNGRDTALMMSRIHEGCNIILGSATPSLESAYNAKSSKYIQVSLHEKYHCAAETEIEIIDTKAERRKRGMVGNFSRKLIDHMKATLQSGEQILILRSRRAWATSLQCEQCGEIQKCPHCNVSLSLHKTKGTMICHYCGFSAPYTGHCVKCSGELTSMGAGTQKIEEETIALFPNATVSRLDSDSSESQKKIIDDFAKGRTDILIGTQIIGKGFDFSNLGLVAVIAADGMLGIQDFRADEKAFHLLEQFKGRCGRREKKGMFVIQTSQPEHPVYNNLSSSGQSDFSDSLLMERKDFGFPPYSRILEISIKAHYEDRAERMAGWLAEKLAGHNITGPYTPVIDKIADQYIRKIRICLSKDKTLYQKKKQIKEIVASFEKSRRYDGHIIIDVDPS